MAAALDAGLRGEETAPTAAFATGQTAMLGHDVDDTQALPRTSRTYARSGTPARAARPRRRHPRDVATRPRPARGACG